MASDVPVFNFCIACLHCPRTIMTSHGLPLKSWTVTEDYILRHRLHQHAHSATQDTINWPALKQIQISMWSENW